MAAVIVPIDRSQKGGTAALRWMIGLATLATDASGQQVPVRVFYLNQSVGLVRETVRGPSVLIKD